jgi:malic enzyme
MSLPDEQCEVETELEGLALITNPMLNKGTAFSESERDLFRLHGLLPPHVGTLEHQASRRLNALRRYQTGFERYAFLRELQDTNETVFYALLTRNIEELLPIAYTPTVGAGCQHFSRLFRKPRGLFLSLRHRKRIKQILSNPQFDRTEVIVVTDGERILGLGDQGAGGMAIPIGKLALYSAGGIHPAITLPVSLDVGTDNPDLLEDPLYVGHRAPRLRGPAYDALVEAFVEGVAEVWPDCLIQWEDFKQHNALRILDRYRDRVPSFNDDIQGTAAVVVAGVLAGMRGLGTRLAEARVVLVGAGAAGIGIARLLRLAMVEDGLPEDVVRRAIVLVDSQGLVHDRREDLDDGKRRLACPADAFTGYGFSAEYPGLVETIERVRPAVLVGTTAVGGAFDEAVISSLARGTARPIVMPLSNPTSSAEATPADILRWTAGRAVVATGSPFEPVEVDGVRREIGQANNVFIFPGVGLGAIAAETRAITERMFLLAARTLAEAVSPARFASGAIYPPVGELRSVTRSIAAVVAREAIDAGLAGIPPDTDIDALIDAAIWWPDYAPYVPARVAERRRASEAT